MRTGVRTHFAVPLAAAAMAVGASAAAQSPSGVPSREPQGPIATKDALAQRTATRADAAIKRTGGIAGPASNCCVPHGTPGCDDPKCEALVCGADPFCCTNSWDTLCTSAALANCAVCATGASNCCTPHPTPGCDDPECEALVCGADPFCCSTQWDALCANAAIANCAVCEGAAGCPPSANDCCAPGVGPGCNDPACCGLVCSQDPFCCENQWDRLCANVAAQLCPQCQFVPPRNDNCTDGIPIGELCELVYSTLGSTSDGPPHALCENGTPDQMVNQDIWYDYTASWDGDVSVSLCGSAFNTKLAVYEGCSCELSDANLIACADDTCGLRSAITFAATAGHCYKIRIGGHLRAVGNGKLTITNSGAPSTSSCQSDVTNNGVTDVDDLLVIIYGWGPCPQ